jgi:hypothetical protein
MKLTTSRVVAFIVTPLLTLVAGGIATVGAKYGLHVNATDVTVDGVAVATAVTGLAIKWLSGNSTYERLVLSLEHELKLVTAADPTAVAGVEHAVETAAPKLVEKAEEAIGAPADAFPPAPTDTVVVPVAPAPAA